MGTAMGTVESQPTELRPGRPEVGLIGSMTSLIVARSSTRRKRQTIGDRQRKFARGPKRLLTMCRVRDII